MDNFDSQGRISPIGAAGQGIPSNKIADKKGQGQGPFSQSRKKMAPAEAPEEQGAETKKEDHAIDIRV
jgi:hypothetical protein